MELIYTYLISAAICWIAAKTDTTERKVLDVFLVICPVANTVCAVIVIWIWIFAIIPSFKFWDKPVYWFFLKKKPSEEE